MSWLTRARFLFDRQAHTRDDAMSKSRAVQTVSEPAVPRVGAQPTSRTQPQKVKDKMKGEKLALLDQLFPRGHFYGVRVLHEPVAAVVDIVFIHGLTGNP